MKNRIKKFLSYLWGKRDELTDMGEKDALLAKVVLDIHRKRTESVIKNVALFDIYPIHPINRENALEATKKRIDILKKNKKALKEAQLLDSSALKELIPSVSAIKVVRVDGDKLISFEGNGRLKALQTVFDRVDTMSVEVEEYLFKNPGKMIIRINKIRKLHNLI